MTRPTSAARTVPAANVPALTELGRKELQAVDGGHTKKACLYSPFTGKKYCTKVPHVHIRVHF